MKTKEAVPARCTAKRKLCFREAAAIKQIADDCRSQVTFIKGSRIGSTKSILSLVTMQICEGDSFLLTAKGEKPDTALIQVMKLLLEVD